MSSRLYRDDERDLVSPKLLAPFPDIIDIEDFDPEVIEECVTLARAIGQWREGDSQVREHHQQLLGIGDTDIQAIRFIIAKNTHGELVTPSSLAKHLHISTASVTKLLDRLERQGHVHRDQHPYDRRSISVSVTPATVHRVRRTLGRKHARRFAVMAAMSREDRAAVIRFLEAMGAAIRREDDESPAPAPQQNEEK